MFKNFITINFLFLLTLLSCNTEEISELNNDNNVHIHTQISSSKSHARLVMGLNGKGEFTDGDSFTLKFNQYQTNLTKISGKWNPNLTWNEIQGDKAIFSGFYPIIDDAFSRFTHQVETNQNVASNFEKSDLLYADEVQINKGEFVNLQFRHLLSCLTVELKSNFFTSEELSNAVIKIRAYNKIFVNANGSLSDLYDYEYGVKNIPEITLKHREGSIFQAILCPQSVHTIDYGLWWLNIKVNGKEYFIKNPPTTFNDGTNFEGFQSGKNVKLNYTLNEKTADPEFAHKTIWVYGLKDMPSPKSTEWKVYARYKDVEFKHLPWDNKYGWYDANKDDLINPNNGFDQNLCWAASASNMLHWWIDRNRDNIDKYCFLNNIQKESIPQRFFDRNHSEIFDIYKRNFQNHGGWPDEGIKWFLWGEYSTRGNGATLLGKDGGYFKKVFNNHSKLVNARGIGTMEHLNDALKKALMNKQAIGVNIEFQGMPNGHALTIWGASFDEFGMVNEIYYSENNDGDNSTPKPHSGLLAARVGSYEGKVASLKDRACMVNSQGLTALPIRELIFLSIGSEIWDDYFKLNER